jgi:hypothetical protein
MAQSLSPALDGDTDRRISAAELRVCMRGREDVPAEEAEALVALVDSDGDGMLCCEAKEATGSRAGTSRCRSSPPRKGSSPTPSSCSS